jgi:sulfoxide reductase heme-binding subunit YedZ
MKLRHLPIFRILVHAGAWLPLVWLVWDAFAGNLSVNPIQDIEQRTGLYALFLLVLALACTPLNTFLGLRQALTVRRALGLYGFLYAILHFFIVIGLDYAFDWEQIFGLVTQKPYIIVGLSALLILLPLAITSFPWWMKHLKKNWKRMHKLIYLAVPLVVIHFAWASKGNLLRLQGNILLPFEYGLVVLLLLAARLPPVRRLATRLRTATRKLWAEQAISQHLWLIPGSVPSYARNANPSSRSGHRPGTGETHHNTGG